MTEKLIILGSGPAGYTAAIYAARSGLEPLLVEGVQPGGQLTITTDVDNYPGFPKGIQGPDLMIAMREQAERFGTRISSGNVIKVELKKRPFKLSTEDKSHECETLIVATGATARWIGLESEQKLRGKGVSACATCDGFFFKNRRVVVVGGGDTALEEALYLANFAGSVDMVHRRDEFRASKAMQERVKNNKKITVIWDSVVEDINDVSKNKVTSVVLKNVKDNKLKEHPCDGVFVAIGHEPNTVLFDGVLQRDEKGYLITRQGSTYTNIEGVFAAGDVADPVYRQAVTAAGSGCAAAIDAERWLQSKSLSP
ncbi:MAG: thioredoxin-disulfide reductase [Deltaproteobacteria bacterium CG11_big_fil_rev_8_21_14_0_20_49_13]|nr:MAG: thioredoxin-disulfide reductase [Deltaproteobacteria bacterium CG11_big_fil_rev_8_21_14_0_20_49_13]